MAGPKNVWAFDIGQCALKAMNAQMGDEKIELIDLVVIEHEQILSQPDADEPKLIRQTLKKFIDSHNITPNEQVIITIPGHRSFSRFSKLPPVDPKKLGDIIEYEARQQIPFGIDEVIWDYHIFKHEELPDIEVGIFAVKKQIIKQYLEYFHEVGIDVTSIQIAPIAIYNAGIYEELVTDNATIFADIGTQNTNFLIADDFRLWTRNIPLGGNNFTEALQKSFKLNFAKAEQLKRTAATSKYARAVFQSMRPIFSELSAEFQRSIGYYTSINRDATIEQVYVMGNANLLPGLIKFLQQNLGHKINRFDNFSKLQLTDSVNETEFTDNILSLQTAYGLAIQQLGLARVNTNLMPPEIIRQTLWKRKQYWFIGTAACLALSAGAIWLRAASDTRAIEMDKQQNEPKIQSIVNKYTKLKSEYQRYTNLESFKSPLVKDLQKITTKRVLMPEILEEISASVPKPQDGLATAKTPEEYIQAAKSIPREERNEVFISNIKFSYIPELTDEILAQLESSARKARLQTKVRKRQQPGVGEMGFGPGMPGEFGPGMMPGEFGPPGMGPGAMGMPGGPGSSKKGRRRRSKKSRRSKRSAANVSTERKNDAFVVTISGTTPHKNAPAFLTQTIMKNLEQRNADYAKSHNLSFWIDKIKLVSCPPLIPPDQKDQFFKDGQYDGPVDELTGEPLINDTCFTITCVVHLGKPEDKAKAQSSASSSDNNDILKIKRSKRRRSRRKRG